MSTACPKSATEKLLAEFPPVSYDDWRTLVEAELKGAPFDKKMFSTTHEGITLKPIYCRSDTANLPHLNSLPGFAPFVRGASASGHVKEAWKISQEIAIASPMEFNHAARTSISGGLNALNMVLDRATRNGQDPDGAPAEDVGCGGLSLATLSDLDCALAGVDLETTPIFIRTGASALPVAALLLALVRSRKQAAVNLRGCIETDPLGVLAHEGRLPQSLGHAYAEMTVLTSWAVRNAPHLQTICVHSRPWHESGGSAVQELAYTVATGIEYLRQLHQRGVEVSVAAPRLRFAVTVGTNFFMEIAKLRALRMLWSRAVAVGGGGEAAQKLSLHVRSSQWNKSVVDPYNNLLRTTVESLAGVLGGCDSMQVGAYDEVARQPNDFSLRIARNTQLVLQKECHLNHVIDPAGGSWFIEHLTHELATRAWALFQEVEARGGMETALRAGGPQKAVDETAAKKRKAVGARRDSIVGVNQYANPKEPPLEGSVTEPKAFHQDRVRQLSAQRASRDAASTREVCARLAEWSEPRDDAFFDACAVAAGAGATLGEIISAIRNEDAPGEPIQPVCIARAAVGFEQLRAAMYRRPQGPAKVFLCNMGPLKEHKARADFARGFFSAGGYDVIAPAGFPTPAEAAAALRDSQAEVAVICATDENYPALVPALTAAIRANQPGTLIVLAGYPADQIAAHQKAGVEEFIHLRADAHEVLARIHAKLGISK
ncbi:MAG TPA: methylmalonyl-CoA mutase family protein [Dongiaceae bacterium]|nr:methylmalonyl-CoA mutase family protein [Dongiaceae bacterium]